MTHNQWPPQGLLLCRDLETQYTNTQSTENVCTAKTNVCRVRVSNPQTPVQRPKESVISMHFMYKKKTHFTVHLTTHTHYCVHIRFIRTRKDSLKHLHNMKYSDEIYVQNCLWFTIDHSTLHILKWQCKVLLNMTSIKFIFV